MIDGDWLLERVLLLGLDSGDLPVDSLLEFFGLFLSSNTYTVSLSYAVIVTNESNGLLGLRRFEARVQFEVLQGKIEPRSPLRILIEAYDVDLPGSAISEQHPPCIGFFVLLQTKDT